MDDIIKEKAMQYLLKLGLKLAREMQENITRNGNIDTGRLRASIQVVREGDSVVVGTNVKYAPAIEFGTRPHFPPVEPLKDWARRKLKADNPEETARAIAWKIYHYGTPAYPFMRPAIAKIEQFAREIKI